MRVIIDLVYLLLAIGYSPCVVYRMIRQNRYRTGWDNRFGNILRKDPALNKCIWIHAVSVGEVNATKTLVEELKNNFPDYQILITTTTDTGFARAKALYADDCAVAYFPLDFYCVMQRAFASIRPTICLLMELEVWPNFLQIANRLHVPVVVVNGRISDKSFAGYKKIKPISRNIFRKLTLILAQTEEYARRFKEIGARAESVIVTGSLKYDTAQTANAVKGAAELARSLDITDEKLWVAGGTGTDEEKLLLDVFRKLKKQEQLTDLRLVIVPRKPERFEEVADVIAEAGFDFIRYSSVKNGDITQPPKAPVILGDTMGDLRKFYSLATVVFVGRSLVPMGGSDMIEAAALAKCTIFGPHAFNFRQTVNALLEGDGAIKVEDTAELFDALKKSLLDPDYAKQTAKAGQKVIKKNQGATQKTVDQIKKLLTTA